jgi:hypothetical protein
LGNQQSAPHACVITDIEDSARFQASPSLLGLLRKSLSR